MTDGLLSGLRVLDLTIWRPGPYATQLLAELGADVLKIEPPGGDPMRVYAGLFTSLSADKRSIVLDLKDDADRARALELAADADVVIEGYRPGVADRLGVGYDDVRAVNPSVVYCSVSGLGQDGALNQAPGHDLNYLAWSGALSPEGGPPREPAVPVADLSGGMAAAFAICAAVIRQRGTGEGERIDVAMADVLATWTGATAPQAEGTDESARGVPGYGTFATADNRFVVLGVLTENHFWHPLCETLGLDDVGQLAFVERMSRYEELQERVRGAIAGRARDELVGQLLAAGVPVAPVLDRAEMVQLPHFRDRRAVTSDPWADPNTGYPVRFQHHPANRTEPPPHLDEHRGEGFRPR
ncbi:MAG: CoA transferase [Acidimicrobiales bacterium]|nr:CoA transferase [Acidimicrobiales bacterium]